jgi:hypothetical protein
MKATEVFNRTNLAIGLRKHQASALPDLNRPDVLDLRQVLGGVAERPPTHTLDPE